MHPPAKTADAFARDEQAKATQAERAELEKQERQRLTRRHEATDKKTQLIRQKLDQVIDAEFPAGTTLEQLLKHIKQATTNANFPRNPNLRESDRLTGSQTEHGSRRLR